MKPFWLGAALVLIAGGSAARLYTRWHEEAADRRVAILADWSEVREATIRTGIADRDLLQILATSGVNTVLIGPSTVQDYLDQKMTFSSRAFAEAILRQTEERSLSGVAIKRSGKNFVLTNAQKSWEALKDIELGFNPELLGMARQAGLHVVLRVNNDPWIPKDKFFADISEILSANQGIAFLLNTDDMPGGPDALPDWVALFQNSDSFQLLFEFHPAKAAVKAALRAPQSTFRAHTIPPPELKDLTDAQQLSRWRRAVIERACRFLLFHMAPSDSLKSFLWNVHAMQNFLGTRDCEIGWPQARSAWHFPSLSERAIDPLLALLAAILAPVLALKVSRGVPARKAYVRIFLLTLAGSLVMAALADNAWSRLEVVPFRGVKLAFGLAWLGSFLMLYTWEEIQKELNQYIRRVDVLAALVVAALAGYMILRTGNAGSGWKSGWEQNLRDRLEFIFVARPRFKEFAIGYPLLFLGLHLRRGIQPFWRDGRFWMGVGMIGPISMVNTFCHLHSPLYLALWRSLNGFVLGTLVGAAALLTVKKWRS